MNIGVCVSVCVSKQHISEKAAVSHWILEYYLPSVLFTCVSSSQQTVTEKSIIVLILQTRKTKHREAQLSKITQQEGADLESAARSPTV